MISARTRTTAASTLELHLGRRGSVWRRLEERLGLEAGQARHDGARKQTQASVVLAYGLVEAPALHGDTILGPLELTLQRQEVLVALQLWIALDDHHEPAQRTRELALGSLES